MDVASEALGPLLARSPLVSKGRVARTISIFLGISFSTGRSWVVVEGFVALGSIPFFVFTSFLITLGYLATSEGLSKEVRTLAGLAMPTSATFGVVSVLELAGPDARMAGG